MQVTLLFIGIVGDPVHVDRREFLTNGPWKNGPTLASQLLGEIHTSSSPHGGSQVAKGNINCKH